MQTQLKFDRVLFLNEDGGYSKCSPEQFIALPLQRRIKLMLEHKLSFFLGAQQIEVRVALQNFREWSAQRAALHN